MQTEDFKWFVENYNELFKKYGLCFLAIKNKEVLGTYQSAKDAVSDISKKYPLGSFIVQLCNGDKSGYTNYFANSQFIIPQV